MKRWGEHVSGRYLLVRLDLRKTIAGRYLEPYIASLAERYPGPTGALSTEIERERDLSTPPSSFVPETDFPETTVVGVERAAREHAFFELDLHQIDCAVSIVFNAAGKREGRHVGAGRETTPEVVSSADSTRPSFSQEPVPEPSVSASASPRKVTHQSNGRDDA